MSHTSRFLLYLFAFPLAAPQQSQAANGNRAAIADQFNPGDGPALLSPDWAERTNARTQFFGPVPLAKAFGNTAPSAQQQPGALSGKIVFMNSGHGWTWDPAFSPPWRLQRGVGNEMNE